MQSTNDYISIKEASLLTGKHSDTIRRLWQDEKGQVVQEIQKKYTKRDKQNKLLINKDWLLSHFEANISSQTAYNNDNDQIYISDSNMALDSVIKALTNQLEAKDKQILGLQQIINEKEANTTKLQDQFQQLLATQQLPATSSYNNQEADIIPTDSVVPSGVKINESKPKRAKTKTVKTKPAIKSNKAPVKNKKSWWRI